MSLLGRHHRARTSGTPERRDLWTCKRCGVAYVVPTLARDCEAKHDTEGGAVAPERA